MREYEMQQSAWVQRPSQAAKGYSLSSRLFTLNTGALQRKRQPPCKQAAPEHKCQKQPSI